MSFRNSLCQVRLVQEKRIDLEVKAHYSASLLHRNGLLPQTLTGLADAVRSVRGTAAYTGWLGYYSPAISRMKYPLYLILIFSLLSCQPHDNSSPAEANPVATADTAATVPAAPAAPDSAFLIIAGERIGQVQLGMTAEQLNNTLGEADSGDAAMGKALLFWVSKGNSGPRQYVAVYTVNNFDGQDTPPKVQQVQVTSPRFRTASGIGTGNSLPEIRQGYGQLQPLAYYTNAQQQKVYVYDAQPQGIAFEVTVPDSVCSAITVHQPGEDVTGTYLPIHPDMTRLQ
ncbi:hypothetical protein MKJ04_08195 [Pontibacter sp. E15-1]|uniref:hypothetical protein n=1 Tax=Pontibacter sp. E15-1 TaxID=2919918 RepID=UPI001F4F643C|nr:hypothetical protein [Pontibacter sp. E15-1]MCJ8164822.1 hypothetical protein [Pontibacter sp. E15-1]